MLITNFASGELSRNLNGRVDIQQYYQGAAKIENFEIIPTGGIKRRVGTKRIAELSGNNRIIPFIVDKNSVYILELGLNPNYDASVEGSKRSYIRVWQRGLAGSYSVIQTLYTDYNSLAVIGELQYTQNYDTMIFVHKDYPPFELYMSAGTFYGNTMTFNFFADVELDDDFDFIMIPEGNFPAKETTADGHGRFTYNRMINGVSTLYTKDFGAGIHDFWCIKDGKLYKWDVYQWVTYGSDPQIDTNLFGQLNKYPACAAFFNNRLFFAASVLKPQMIWASAAPDNYGTRYKDFSTYRKYVTVNRVAKEADLHVFTCDINPSDAHDGTCVLRNVTHDFTAGLSHPVTEYYVSGSHIPAGTKVLSVTADTIVINTQDVKFPETHVSTLPLDPVSNGSGSEGSGSGGTSGGSVSEGSSSPNATTISGGVQIVKEPLTNEVITIQLWRNADNISADDYDFMVAASNVTTADCSLFFELASDQNDAIKFLSSNRFLAAGTESSIWSIDPGISAVNVHAVMQGRYGSDDIQGQAVETATVFFAQGKKGIREFYYDGQSEAFRTNNIALLADHILRESAVIDFDYMTNPYSRLMVVREDGIVAEMLYDKTNGIMAWSRLIVSGGKVRNCAVTRGYDEADLVFFVVQTNDATPRYFLELYDMGSDIFLDSWKPYNTASLNPADGYNTGAILWNKTKDITCPYDAIPLDFIYSGDEVYIGYDYRSYIKSMPVVAGELSAKKQIKALYLYLLESYLPVVKVTGMNDEHFNTIQTLPHSGIAKVNYPGITDRDAHFELEATGTKPVNILSVEAQLA